MMDLLPTLDAEFFARLGVIILADLVLAGDNAVVIALAARNLPKELQRRAVFFGAMAAIALRAGLTVFATQLLEIPLLKAIGGLFLLRIGWKLARDDGDGEEVVDSATNIRGAIKTILIADVVMSLDNVIAVAGTAQGAEHGGYALIIIGLLVSIPIVMGGASVLLRLVERYPIIVWIGAFLVAYVGFELILTDPIIHDYLPSGITGPVTERLVGAGLGATLAGLAWYIGRHDDADEPQGVL